MSKKFSLLQYSTAAVALLGVTTASSQVIYTDIDPDVVLDEPNEMFGIDLDADGLNDFNFFNESFTTTVFYGDLANVKALFVGAFDTMQNGIIGQTVYLSGAGGYTYFQPSVLEQGFVINDINVFFNDNYQTLAKTSYESGYFPSTDHSGNWNPYFWGEQIEKFLGFRFTDGDDIQRYGWIRCSVIDSGRTLIIHDYAYELQPDQPIIAGDTISYVDIPIQNEINIKIYSFCKSLFIELPNSNTAQLMIADISGMEVVVGNLFNQFKIIDMSQFPSGIYLVTIIQDGKQLNTKVIID